MSARESIDLPDHRQEPDGSRGEQRSDPAALQSDTPPSGLPPGRKLNLGCGDVQPAGWTNVDGSTRAWLAKRAAPIDWLLTRLGLIGPTRFGRHIELLNLCKPLPYDDESVSCVFGGEVWEHLEYEQAGRLTAECYRVLRPGGVLRVCVPDGEEYWRRYCELLDAEYARPAAQRDADRLRHHVELFFADICVRRPWLGSMTHFHKWQYDALQLTAMFEAAGFTQVERKRIHDSRIPDISSLESKDFLIVEGVKCDDSPCAG